jgi:TonB family protein
MSSATIVLKVFSGAECIATHRVSRELVKIGRLATSHVRLDDDSIARMHAVLEVGEREVRLVDLGSNTGTLVNGVAVERSTAIRAGDRIEVGPYTMLVDVEHAAVLAPAVPGAAPALAQEVRAERPSTPPFVRMPEVEHDAAAPVAEVISTWHGRVHDVQHVGQGVTRRTDASAWIALGALLVCGGAGVFAHEVTQDWSSYQETARTAAETGRPIPAAPGWGLGGLGLGLALMGLAPLAFGITRRADRPRTSYVLGESPHASFPVAASTLAGASAFTLVRRGEHGIALRYTDGMRGDVTVDGTTMDLREATALGRARFDGDAFELPLVAGAQAKVGFGDHLFHVRAVAPGRVLAGKQEADKPFWIASGGAAAVIGGIIILSQLIPETASDFSLDESLADNRFVGYIHQPDDEPDPPMTVEELEGEAQGGTPGKRAPGHEGKMGNPTSKQSGKMYAMKGPKTAIPQIARNFDPDMAARNAGLLGLIQSDQGHFLSSPNGAAFAVGNDDEDAWGNMTGTDIGESYGVGGMGMVGTGRGGGCDGSDCGIIGLGKVGTMGDFGKNGRGGGYDHGDGGGTKFDGRPTRVPKVRAAIGTVSPGIDKEIIRRVIRSHLMEVRGCYNQGLVRDPNLNGRVAIQFTIGPTGSVGAAVVAETSVDDSGVGNCIAKAVKRWKFPKPDTGGSTIVTYPFVLSPG